MLEKIDQLRENLNELMSKEEKDVNKILKISQELDVLIIEFYKKAGVYKC